MNIIVAISHPENMKDLEKFSKTKRESVRKIMPTNCFQKQLNAKCESKVGELYISFGVHILIVAASLSPIDHSSHQVWKLDVEMDFSFNYVVFSRPCHSDQIIAHRLMS